MTPFEQWLLNNTIPIVATIVIGCIAWSKIASVDALRADLAKHKTDDQPHTACPVHSSQLAGIKADIGEVKKTIDKIDSRVFQLLKANGHTEEE